MVGQDVPGVEAARVDQRQRIPDRGAVDRLPGVVPRERPLPGRIQRFAPLGQGALAVGSGVGDVVVAVRKPCVGGEKVRPVLGAHQVVRDEHFVRACESLYDAGDFLVVSGFNRRFVPEIGHARLVARQREPGRVEVHFRAARVFDGYRVLGGVGAPGRRSPMTGGTLRCFHSGLMNRISAVTVPDIAASARDSRILSEAWLKRPSIGDLNTAGEGRSWAMQLHPT